MNSIETLLLTGENNHDWRRSSAFCRDMMQGSRKFNVELSERPSEALADRGDLSRFGLIFIDYNGPDWSAKAKDNFAGAVRNGAGVCILHAADNSFRGWKEYEEICALAWRDGASHGSYHKFDVRITDSEHPVTKGLPCILKDHPDELYDRLTHMHGTPYKTIAAAHSSEESGGTGKDEPALVVKTYGNGRIFHCILGHVWPGGPMTTFENPDFQRVLMRGCEWAATGEVTIP